MDNQGCVLEVYVVWEILDLELKKMGWKRRGGKRMPY